MHGEVDDFPSRIFQKARSCNLNRDELVRRVLQRAIVQEGDPKTAAVAVRNLFITLRLYREDEGGAMGDMRILCPNDVPVVYISMVRQLRRRRVFEAFVYSGLDLSKVWEIEIGDVIVRVDLWYWAIECESVTIVKRLAMEGIEPIREGRVCASSLHQV